MRAITISRLSAILFTASSVLSWAAPEAAKESKPSAPVLLGVNRIVVTDGKIQAKADTSTAAASAPQGEVAQPASADLRRVVKVVNGKKYKF